MVSFRFHTQSFLITCICMVCFLLPFKEGFTPVWSMGNAVYHFFHANIFHLLANIIALWQFRPRWHTLIVAFIVSSLCSLLPFASLAEPTCGLSAFLFAAYARRFVSWRLNPTRLIAINIALAFVPHMNWRIHVLSFLVSYIYWYGYYSYRDSH